MKKFFTLMLALVAVIAVNAKQVVFDFTNPSALGIKAPEDGKGTNITGQNLEVDGVTMSNVKVASTDTRIWNTKGAYDLRIYTNSTLTFTTTDSITAIEFVGSAVGFKEFSGKTWTGSASAVTVTASSTNKIQKAILTIGETADVWIPDTISVSQANALIATSDSHDHFVYGVVMGDPFITYASFNGHASFWMSDLVNSNDTIELYDGYGKNNAKWASMDEVKKTIHKGDTVLVYAGALQAYTNSKTGITINEITSGYYAETLGANPDVPEDTIVIPDLPEGVITCAGAVELAASAADPTETNKNVEVADVKVRGFVTYAYEAKNGKQSAWIADEKGAKTGAVQGYNLEITKGVAVGDYVQMDGKLVKFFKAADNIILEITNGTMVIVGDTTPTPPVETPDTITVAQALEIGKALQVSDKNNKYPSEKSYVIKGYSCGIEQAYDTTYKNETFWISDTKGTRTIDKAVAFEVYRGKPNTQQEIGLDALVQFQCKILNFNGTIENYDSNMAVEVIEQGIIETVDTITVAAALEIAKNLTVSDKDNKYPSEKSYAIKGYVSSIVDYYDAQYKNETFWITDSLGARTSDKNIAFEVYRGKPNPAGEVGMDAYVLITCKIINFNGTAENFESGPTVEVLEPGKPVIVDTISVAEALEIGQALPDNGYTDNPYVVIGYVTKAYEPDSGYTSQNFYMADDPDARGDFYAYRAKPDAKIFTGDYVELFGKIQKYVGTKGTTIELSNGTVKHLEAPKLDTLTVAEVQALDLAEEATTVERFVVIGYVAAITADFEEDLQSFNLSDDATATTGEFACLDAIIAEPGANLHDQVKIVGKIQKLNGKFRMVSGKATVLNGQGIENIVLTEKAQKVMMDGVVYIIRDNKIFNLQGTQVR